MAPLAVGHTVLPSLSENGKKPKRFLGKNDTLQLATAIAGAQEKKASSKAQRIHIARSSQRESPGPRLSASKAKLKETKALLAAQRSRKKNDKAKLKKRDDLSRDDASHASGPSTAKLKKPIKRVSFA